MILPGDGIPVTVTHFLSFPLVKTGNVCQIPGDPRYLKNVVTITDRADRLTALLTILQSCDMFVCAIGMIQFAHLFKMNLSAFRTVLSINEVIVIKNGITGMTFPS